MRLSWSSSPSTINWVSAMRIVEHLEITQPEGGLEGLHVEPVAGQHAGMVAPDDVGGRLATAGFSHVNDVIVNQRGGVGAVSTMAARRMAVSLVSPSSLVVSRSSMGRIRLPPLDCR